MPLGVLREEDFFGRREELTDLYHRSLEAEKGNAQSIFLSGVRGTGKTELLKQLFNYLFWKQEGIAPFYYSVNSAILSVSDFSRNYLTHYICQRLAFEKKESSLLYLEGISIEGLTSILEEREAIWGLEILQRYTQSHEPLDSLRIALNAPQQSTLSTGIPVVVMIDEFQRLNGLNIGGNSNPALVSLFETPLSFRKTPHIITGNQAEICEMPIARGLTGIDLQPLRLKEAGQMFSVLLQVYGIKIDLAHHGILLNRLGGNPFYLRCVARAIGLNKKSEVSETTRSEMDCLRAYINDVCNGNIYLYWSSALKGFFPELKRRENALEILQKIYHEESLTPQRVSKAFSLSMGDAETIVNTIYLAGFVSGEFGILRKPQDMVLIDFIDCLYKREILGKSYRDIEKELLERAYTKGKAISFELTIPMLKDTELVAAQCLEQIGKNLHFNPAIIGQLQMAVIEGCINAMEHSKSEDKKIYLNFDYTGENLEIAIESSGMEFISPETGEPYTGKVLKEETVRGWGIKFMKSFADSVRFERTGRGTRVVLVKNLVSAQKEGIADSE